MTKTYLFRSDSNRPEVIRHEWDSLDMVEEAPVGIYIVKEGNIIWGNRWLREFSGHGLDDLPMSALTVIAPEDRAFVVEQMALRLRGGEALPNYTVKYLKKDGTTVEVELVARVITFRGGAAILGSIVDLSEKISTERKLREYAERLEISGAFRQFISELLSHDLLNRLWVAEHMVETMPQENLSDLQLATLLDLKGSISRALEILRETNAYLKLSDEQDLKREVLHLGAMLRRMAAEFGPALKAKGMTLSITGDEIALSGSHLLKEVFNNLISNAVKFGPEGSVILVELEDGPVVCIRVIDTGPGIPDEHKINIFRKFERLGGGKAKGVGLGLAIVRRIVDLHQGRVRVEDNPDGGSIFIVEFPKGKPAALGGG